MTKFLRSRILRWVFGAVGAVLALTPHVHAQMTGRSGRTVSDRPAVLNTALPTDESGQTYGGQPTNIDPILNPVDASVDLVFTPVTPCRIIDTRVAGGAIAAGTTRNFLASGGPYTTQGGSSGSCGIPFPAAVAVVINYVAVSPAGAGDLRVTPFGTAMPTASVINYAAVGGLAVANGVATSICGDISCVFDITIQADVSATHLVADVMGYYRDITCQAGDGDRGAEKADVDIPTRIVGAPTLREPDGYGAAGDWIGAPFSSRRQPPHARHHRRVDRLRLLRHRRTRLRWHGHREWRFFHTSGYAHQSSVPLRVP